MGPRGFQSVIQDRDDLISWDGDLSAGGPSDGIPQGTEGGDNLPGPSRAEFDQVVRQRDQALQHCGEMLRALQQASQAMAEHGTGEPSPNHGRDSDSILSDDPDRTYVLGIVTSHRDRPSRGSHSVEDFCPGGGVRTSCAPETGSGEARSSSQARVTINEFGPCGPRASYSQPNISPGVEFRENSRVEREPTGCGFKEQFPTYHCRDDFVRTHDVDARSRGYYATGSPIDPNVVVQGSPVRSSQTDNVDPPHIATANLAANGDRFRRKQKEPDKFDGDKIEWADFITHFNVVARWNDWTYSEKGLQLATCLRGKAQKVLSSIPESLNGDYETVRSTLEKRFSPPHRENSFRAVFRRRKREARESLMDYGSDVMRLAQRAYPEFSYDALDQVAREQFISGLSDIEMKRFVDLRGPHSLDEAVSLATQFESFELSENSTGLNSRLEAKGKTRSAPVQAATETPSSIESQFSKLSSAFEKKMAVFDQKMVTFDARLDAMKAGSREPERTFSPGNNYARQPKSPPQGRLGNCYGCGQPGHFKRNCPKLRARIEPQTVNTNKEPPEQKTVQSPGQGVARKSKASQSQRVTDIKGGYLISGKIQGMAVDLLIDSGSDLTLIDIETFNSIPESVRPWLQETQVRLSTASGSAMSTRGEALFRLKFGNSEWDQRFVVAQLGATKAILGSDFLCKYKTVLDMGLGILTIGNESHLLQAERTETCCRVRLKENLIIPPQHEVQLVGMLDRPQADSVPVKQGLLQPTASLVEETGLFMGNSLVDTSSPLVPVTLLNLDQEPKSLPRGFTVGLMEQVEGVEKGETTSPQTLEAGSEKSQIEHLLPLLDNVSDRLEGGQRERILDLVLRYQHIFATPDGELGHTTLADHTIDTGDSRPIKQPPRRMPPLQRELADREVDKMLEKGFIEPSDSPWASPIVLVTKKDGSTCFCIDYRRLNDVTRKDAYPLPNINETLETLSGAEWFNTLDLASGYWQVPVAPADRAKTAFTTRKGLFEWKVMPFGLSNAPATFSRLMELALRGLHWERCLVYLDDIVVFGRNFEQALENLELVFDRLASAGLKLKPKKCALF